jgi:hypothetical protein
VYRWLEILVSHIHKAGQVSLTARVMARRLCMVITFHGVRCFRVRSWIVLTYCVIFILKHVFNTITFYIPVHDSEIKLSLQFGLHLSCTASMARLSLVCNHYASAVVLSGWRIHISKICPQHQYKGWIYTVLCGWRLHHW